MKEHATKQAQNTVRKKKENGPRDCLKNLPTFAACSLSIAAMLRQSALSIRKQALFLKK